MAGKIHVGSSRPEHLCEIVYNKLINSKLEPAQVKEVLDSCTPCVSNDDVQVVFNNIAAKNKLAGPAIILKPEQNVGRITVLNDASYYIHLAMLKAPITEKIPPYPADTISDFLYCLAPNTPIVSVGKMKAAKIFLSHLDKISYKYDSCKPSGPGVCWVFIPPSPETTDQVYTHVAAPCLPCRLGLPQADTIDGKEVDYLALSFRSGSLMSLSYATALDGDYISVRDYWGIEGKTVPLDTCSDECKSLLGLDEAVCQPPGYHSREGEIYVINAE